MKNLTSFDQRKDETINDVQSSSTKNPWKIENPPDCFERNYGYEEIGYETDHLPTASNALSQSSSLCPYFEQFGCCVNEQHCKFLHGLFCDMCQTFALHPLNEEMRRFHHRTCLERHEKDMEEAFAHSRSLNKPCGICMEKVVNQ
jgi:hypothetical protein